MVSAKQKELPILIYCSRKLCPAPDSKSPGHDTPTCQVLMASAFPQAVALSLAGKLDDSATQYEEFSNLGWCLWPKAEVGQRSLEERRVALALKPNHSRATAANNLSLSVGAGPGTAHSPSHIMLMPILEAGSGV